MDIRPVLHVIGLFLLILAASMFVPMLVDLYVDNSDWKTFFACIVLTSFFGGALVIGTWGQNFDLSLRQTFLLTTLSWLSISLFGALPLYMSGLDISFVDALFESVSGVTTTGGTVLSGLDEMPPGILMWRSMLQWLGGIGFIVMAMSILPMLKVGGMQLFRTESSLNEKALPRAAQLASSLGIVYLALTALCAMVYSMTGMSGFDSVAHAMTTISTGGYSTHDASLAYYKNPWTQWTSIFFMVLSGLPFVLFLKIFMGRAVKILKDSQVQAYLGILTLSALLLTMYLVNHGADFATAFRHASFSVVSVMTGTGYSNVDFALWGSFATGLLLFLMAVGGCAGSTTCGIKIFRFQILYEVAQVQIKRLLHPHATFILRYNGRPIAADIPIAVMSFFFIYAAIFAVAVILLSLTGLDFTTSISGVMASLSNVGPGLGTIVGPTGSFAPLPDMSKILLCICMFLGRLELFTVLVLFSPQFWRS